MSNTLTEIVTLYEATRPVQTVLTPLGQTTASLFKLKRQVRALDTQDRTVALAQLRAVLADLETPVTA